MLAWLEGGWTAQKPLCSSVKPARKLSIGAAIEGVSTTSKLIPCKGRALVSLEGSKQGHTCSKAAHGSKNAETGRFDIQGKCKLSDGSCKTMGILGFYEKEHVGVQVWQTLMARVNDAKGKHTKGELISLRDELIACCKAGQPCIAIDAD